MTKEETLQIIKWINELKPNNELVWDIAKMYPDKGYSTIMFYKKRCKEINNLMRKGFEYEKAELFARNEDWERRKKVELMGRKK